MMLVRQRRGLTTVARPVERAMALVYEAYGSPDEKLQLKAIPTEQLDVRDADDVLVEMIAAPINPADINQIQGVYPVKPPLPAVGGNEGVGRVITAGAAAKTMLSPGTWVIPLGSGSGTWRTHGVFKASQLMPLPPNISVEFAATVSVNPCTAYRMLHDFEKLEPKSVVVQNAANSGVGMAVIQIARSLGLHTINVVRNRPSLHELTKTLQDQGGSVVITEEELANTPKLSETIRERGWAMPKLALNAVGGKNATDLARLLANGGTMVTYGAMSKQPVTVPNALLIFKDIRLRGFWMTQWVGAHSPAARAEMLSAIAELHRQGQFSLPTQSWNIEDFRRAIQTAQQPYPTAKHLLRFVP